MALSGSPLPGAVELITVNKGSETIETMVYPETGTELGETSNITLTDKWLHTVLRLTT